MGIKPLSLGNTSNPGRHGAEGAARLINCYAEGMGQEGKTSWPLQASAGLQLFTTAGTGPIRAKLELDNLLYVVSGRSLYKVDENGAAVFVGSIPTDGAVTMARNQRTTYPQIGIVTGGLYYICENGSLTQVSDPDLPPPVSVTYSGGVFVLPTAFSRFFTTADQNGLTIDALDFASAESSWDNNIVSADRENEVVLFGSRSTEWWQFTGGADFPFTRLTTRRVGCLAAKSVTRVGDTIGWIADDGTVRLMSGYDGQTISTGAVARSIAQTADPTSITGVSWDEYGHQFYALIGDDFTWVYDTTTHKWHERESYGLSRWRAATVTTFGQQTIVGDYENGNLYTMSPEYETEADNPLVMTVQTPPAHAYPYRTRINAIYLDAIPGVGLNSTTTADADPQIMFDWSEDGGRTWSAQRFISIGAEGVTKARVKITRIGMTKEDGRTYRFSVSAGVIKTFTGAAIDATIQRN